jgi:hypothetical protein
MLTKNKKMGARCSHLVDFDDACNIGECVVDVQGFGSNSQSPSDIYVLTMAEGSMYQGKKVGLVLAKLSISVESLRRASANPDLNVYFNEGIDPDEYFQKNARLSYEYLVYGNITKPLLQYSICPFFVRIYGVAFNCSSESVLSFLKKARGGQFPEPQLRDNFKRNMFCLFHKSDDLVRPGILDNDKENDKLIADTMAGLRNDKPDFDVSKLTYNIMYSQFLSSSSATSFKSYLNANPLQKTGSGRNMTTRQLSELEWSYIFQVAVACYALSCSKTVHNDLHSGNVFLVNVPNNEPVDVVVNDTLYTLRTDRKAELYDFDLSYSKQLGPNPGLDIDEQYPAYFNEVSTIDFITFVSRCGFLVKKASLEKLENKAQYLEDEKQWCRLFFKDPNDVEDESKRDAFKQEIGFASANFCKQYNDMLTILERLAYYAPSCIKVKPNARLPKDRESDKMFVLRQDFFDEDGRLKIPTFDQYSNTLTL